MAVDVEVDYTQWHKYLCCRIRSTCRMFAIVSCTMESKRLDWPTGWFMDSNLCANRFTAVLLVIDWKVSHIKEGLPHLFLSIVSGGFRILTLPDSGTDDNYGICQVID